MTQLNKTIAFLVCALCAVGAAALTHNSFKPAPPAADSEVGQPFYPEFTDPLAATSLRIAAYDEKSAKVERFAVEQKNGQWTIPSHYNYPADGKDRLAKTAASMIGVTRGQLVTASSEAHKRLNLLNPLDANITGTEGRGTRITISEGDKALTDLIIGKSAEGGGGRYYVRRADEDRVYLTEVQPDVSTKFVDWIQPNLLDTTAANLRELVIDRYHVDEATGREIPGEKSHLKRESSTAEWKLKELNDPTQRVKPSVVNAMTSSLANMKIVGVRPKPPGLTQVLKGENGGGLRQSDIIDLEEKGYFFNQRGQLRSNEGEYLAGAADGVLYVLQFGEVFTGSEMDIEIGSAAKSDSAAKTDGDKPAADPADAAKKPASPDDKADQDQADDARQQKDKGADAPDSEKTESRYVFIMAQFDAGLLGDELKEPVKPTPPPGYKPKDNPRAAQPGQGKTLEPADDVSQPADDETPEPAASETQPAAPPPRADGEKPTTQTESVDPAASLAGPPSDAPVGDPADSAAAATDSPATSAAGPAADGAQPAAAPVAQATENQGQPADSPPAAKTPSDDAPPVVHPAAKPNPLVDDAAAATTPAAPDPEAAYELALKKYAQELDEYKVKKRDLDERITKGKERVQRLNARFADWYYVIPAEVFDSLNVKPDALTEPKPPETTPPGGPIGTQSVLPGDQNTDESPANDASEVPPPPPPIEHPTSSADSTGPASTESAGGQPQDAAPSN